MCNLPSTYSPISSTKQCSICKVRNMYITHEIPFQYVCSALIYSYNIYIYIYMHKHKIMLYMCSLYIYIYLRPLFN